MMEGAVSKKQIYAALSFLLIGFFNICRLNSEIWIAKNIFKWTDLSKVPRPWVGGYLVYKTKHIPSGPEYSFNVWSSSFILKKEKKKLPYHIYMSYSLSMLIGFQTASLIFWNPFRKKNWKLNNAGILLRDIYV